MNTIEKGWTVDTGDGAEPHVVRDYDGEQRATFVVRGDAERYVRDRNREAGVGETGDAHAEVNESMRSRMDDISDLLRVAEGGVDTLSEQEVEALDIGAEYDDHELQDERGLEDAARERLGEMPLGAEATVSFEIVLGTGGPDDRLIVECDAELLEASEHGRFGDCSIRRVLYRYSWTGSAEVELRGGDLVDAEAFARMVVLELSE